MKNITKIVHDCRTARIQYQTRIRQHSSSKSPAACLLCFQTVVKMRGNDATMVLYSPLNRQSCVLLWISAHHHLPYFLLLSVFWGVKGGGGVTLFFSYLICMRVLCLYDYLCKMWIQRRKDTLFQKKKEKKKRTLHIAKYGHVPTFEMRCWHRIQNYCGWVCHVWQTRISFVFI